MSRSIPILSPSVSQQVHADTITMGPAILPIERIRLYSNVQWEEFVLEWAHGLRSKYSRVERCGGAGDMGRDVIAFPEDDKVNVWDNYQCKHYGQPIGPSKIWVELGKLIYYTFRGEFTYPRKYYFVAPQGAGTSLANLMKKPDELRRKLIDHWESHCKNGITSTEEVFLNPDLRKYLDGLDFTIFDYIPPLCLIDEHRLTPYYYARFGGGLPDRPEIPPPPVTPSIIEVAYLQKLFDAYGDHLNREVKSFSDIESDQKLLEHYGDSRIEFYSAEALRGFSRDTLPEGSYEKLQDEVYSGVSDVIRDEHDDGYRRVIAVVRAAKNLPLTSHALVPRLHIRDRGGICHQLANERDNVKWVK